MLELTKENFKKEALESKTPVIVDFWASWCGPCMMMGPVFEKVSNEYKGKLKFAKVSTEESPDLAEEHEIRSIPCLIIFNKGKEVERIIGFQGEAGLKANIDKILKEV
jgi:thioredoxin 1